MLDPEERVSPRLKFPKPRRKPAKQRKPLTRSPVTRGKKIKRFVARRNPALLERVRQLPCILAGRVAVGETVYVYEGRRAEWHQCSAGPIQACHITSRGAAGDDTPANLYAGCGKAHAEQHQLGIKSWAKRWFGSVEKLREVAAAEYGRITADGEHQ